MASFRGDEDEVPLFEFLEFSFHRASTDILSRLVGSTAVHPEDKARWFVRVVVGRDVEIERVIFIPFEKVRNGKRVAFDLASLHLGVLGTSLWLYRANDGIDVSIISAKAFFEPSLFTGATSQSTLGELRCGCLVDGFICGASETESGQQGAGAE